MADTHNFVLASGGVDSLLTLYIAAQTLHPVTPVFIEYGQKWLWERESASMHVEFLKSRHKDVHTIVNDLVTIKIGSLPQKNHYVYGRNLAFATYAAAHALSTVRPPARIIIWFGFNRDEAAVFEDNTEQFLQDATRVLRHYTLPHLFSIHVVSPLLHLSKFDEGVLLRYFDIPLQLVESSAPCYESQERCGKCPSCRHWRRVLAGYRWAEVGDLLKREDLEFYVRILLRLVCDALGGFEDVFHPAPTALREVCEGGSHAKP